MTPGGPEPGWMLDPDDFGRERYWNGVAWTEHRRLIASAESPPSQGPPAARPDDAGPNDVDPARGPWVARAALTTEVAQPEALRGIGDVKPGDTVRVVAGHRQWLGKVGTVRSLTKRLDEDRVVVKFSDSAFEYFYRLEELELLRT